MIGANGDQLGIMSSADALALAEEKELDLVKIAPQAVPPVCRIMDYGKYCFEQQKREKEPLYHLNAASYGWLHAAAHLYRDLMRSGWKRIEAPVLLFQAENDHLVSNRAQERMIRKMAERRPGMAKMVKVPGAKHELFGTRGRMLQTYWNMVFAFLEKDL